jgi:hypothetical protein
MELTITRRDRQLIEVQLATGDATERYGEWG